MAPSSLCLYTWLFCLRTSDLTCPHYLGQNPVSVRIACEDGATLCWRHVSAKRLTERIPDALLLIPAMLFPRLTSRKTQALEILGRCGIPSAARSAQVLPFRQLLVPFFGTSSASSSLLFSPQPRRTAQKRPLASQTQKRKTPKRLPINHSVNPLLFYCYHGSAVRVFHELCNLIGLQCLYKRLNLRTCLLT